MRPPAEGSCRRYGRREDPTRTHSLYAFENKTEERSRTSSALLIQPSFGKGPMLFSAPMT
jgi:hypothetical protein